jgi:hypothetical protein
MSTKRIPLRHTGSAITECWKTAETRTSDAVQAKYWAPGEENITFLFSGELRQAISDANQQGAFGRAFVSDLIAAYPELRAAPHLSHTLTNRLLGSVTFHGHRHEGSTSGSDLGLVIRQPSIVVNGWKPDHLTIHDDYAPGLLVQAKLGRPVKAQPSTIHWRSLTDDQRLLIPVHSAYYSLLLYQWQNPEGTGLCRFQWQTCHGFRVDEIAEWLDEGSFPNLHDSETVLSGLATE